MGIERLELSRFNEPTDFQTVKLDSLFILLDVRVKERIAPVESLHLFHRVPVEVDSGLRCTRFPEFESIHFTGFPVKAQKKSHQNSAEIGPLSPLRLPIPPYPRKMFLLLCSIQEKRKRKKPGCFFFFSRVYYKARESRDS